MENTLTNYYSKRKQNKNNRLTIGFASIADFRSVIGQEIVSGINKAAKDYDVNLINFIGVIRYSFLEDIDSYSHFKKKLKFLNPNNIDGLIAWATNLQYFMPKNEIENFFKSLQPMPMVSIGFPLQDIPTVLIDNYSGMKEIITHLNKIHDIKKIAFIGCKGHNYYEERFENYKTLLKELGLPFREELVFIINEIDNGQHIKNCIDVLLIERNLKMKEDFSAIITVSDLITNRIIEELEVRGYKVPNDIAVLGFNNQLESIRSNPPITTVDPHFFQLGYKAVESLLDVINNKEVKKSILMPCELIIRQSCGCFEDLILKVQNTEDHISHDNPNKSFNDSIKDHYQNIIVKLIEIINKYNNKFDFNYAKDLLESFTSDLTSDTSYKFLNIIKQYFIDYKNIIEDKLFIWQNLISDIRNLLLPFIINNKELLTKAENIFHQSRVLIDVAYSYLNYSKRGDAYKIGAIARIAADFSSVTELKKLIELVKFHINELEIPGAYLAIYDEPKIDLSASHLVLAYNKDREIINLNNELGFINSNSIIPKKYFPKNKRYSLIFNLCYFKENYFGNIIFEMGPLNIPLYDTFRAIFSPSLYNVMINNKENDSDNGKELLLNRIKSKNILLPDSSNSNEVNSFNTHKILEYLYKHINEPTELDKIAHDFHTSKSSLIKKTKKMTGHSLQKLHEMLKMERAILLLENKIMNIAEIAEHLGYQNQFYFSNVFKKHTGMSPKKWVEFIKK